MNTAGLQPGATVECDVRGLVFTATVTGKPAGGAVDVDPPKGITYCRVRARQIKRLVAPAPAAQLQLGVTG